MNQAAQTAASPRVLAGTRHSPADLFSGALLALGIAVHLSFLCSLRFGWLNPLFNDSTHRFGPGCDFFSIYAAGLKARAGDSIFGVGQHLEAVPYAYAFRYAPLVAYTLGAALSLLPPVTAYGLWLVLCELALLNNIRLTLLLCANRRTEPPNKAHHGDTLHYARGQASTRRGTEKEEPEEAGKSAARDPGRHASTPGYGLAAMWLLFSPYYLELYVGQFTFVTASLVFWAYLHWDATNQQAVAVARGRQDQVAGDSGSRQFRLALPPAAAAGDWCWAGAVLLKLMPLLYLPVALLRGRWKAAVTTLAVLGVSSWVYFARFPADWGIFAAINGDPRPTWHAGNQGLMALLFALCGERVGPYLAARCLAIAVVGGVVAWLTWRAALSPRRDGARGPRVPASAKSQRPGARAAGDGAMLVLGAKCGNEGQRSGDHQALPGTSFGPVEGSEAPNRTPSAHFAPRTMLQWLAEPASSGVRAAGDGAVRQRTTQPPAGTRANLSSPSPFRFPSVFICVHLWFQRFRSFRSRPGGDLLPLYAACSAAYLLLYKDVWEHHYVLLLPPLVLLALRRASPWLWLPPFLVCALPGLFALYDLPGLGYNEDPQHYWRPAVSLLHHAWKPLAPAWLLLGLMVRPDFSTQRDTDCTRLNKEGAGSDPEDLKTRIPEYLAGRQDGRTAPCQPEDLKTRIPENPVFPSVSHLVRSVSLCVKSFDGSAVRWAAGVAGLAALVLLAGWAGAAIGEQRRVSRELAWPADVFRRQERPEDCGPAALAAVCRHFGIPAEEAELARLAHTGPGGTSMLGLLEAARAKGLAAEGRQVGTGELRSLPRPCLLFFRGRGPCGHFAVLTGIEGTRCYLADPSAGQQVWSEAALARRWSGEALLVGPAGEPYETTMNTDKHGYEPERVRTKKAPWLLLGVVAAVAVTAAPAPGQPPVSPASALAPAPDLQAALAARISARVPGVHRRVLALYYPWYGTPSLSGKWRHQEGADPARRLIADHVHYPAAGPYDSADQAVIERHLRQTKAAGIDALVCSWWGKDDPTDAALQALLLQARPRKVEVCVLWERLAHPGDAAGTAAELAELLERFGKQAGYLKEAGRPVVFVNAAAGAGLSPDGWAWVLADAARRSPFPPLLIGDAGPQPRLADLLLWDGIYSLGGTLQMAGKGPEESARLQEVALRAPVALARQCGRLAVATLAPGYDDRRVLPPARPGAAGPSQAVPAGTVVERQEGRLFSALWEQALRDGPDWVLVNSFNQWHNGTEIEPSAELGDRYLTLTAAPAARFHQLPEPRR